MRVSVRVTGLAIAACLISSSAWSQVIQWTREDMVKFTSPWQGERFPDGRPKVADALLQKVRGLSSEEVLDIARRGFPSQFESGLKALNPGKKLVGRAVTLQLLPTRQDVSNAVSADWRAKGSGGMGGPSHQSAIDMLQPGDVLVVDAYGSLSMGGIIGDNLAYYIWKTTGNGFVIDGPIRDLEGIANFDMAGYYRYATPSYIQGTMVMGINTPVRIGETTVMPGDVVLGDREGVYFIPPHLVQEVVDNADVTHIHDEWTRKKFDENKYKSSEIYGRPRDAQLLKEYEDYLKQQLGEQRYAEYQKRQQQQQQAPAGGRGGRGGPPPAKKQ